MSEPMDPDPQQASSRDRSAPSGSGGDAFDRLIERLQDLAPDSSPAEGVVSPADAGGAMPPLVPHELRKLSRYVVLRPLGRGGMGTVYLAHPRNLPDHEVALKVLPSLFAVDPERLARFRVEATTASRIDHPGVARVLEIDEELGVHYQIQELVPDGRTLMDWIREAQDARALPKDWYHDVAVIFEQIARALSAVHAANVIHRDIKPSNILLLPDGSPKVADFGLAKDLEGAGGLTRWGSPGTPSFRSPEQIDNGFGEVGQRSDVFSLGATLYEALTLVRLHPGNDSAEVHPRIVRHDVPDLRQVRPGVPRDLSTICRKCLEREPDRRYPSMVALAEDLARYLRDEPITARDPGPVERAVKWCRRNRTASSVLATATLAAVLLGWLAQAERSARAEATTIAIEKGRAVDRFNQLSTVVRLEELLARESELWPPFPEKVPAMEAWLRQADGLLAARPELEVALTELRSRATPRTTEENKAEWRTSPRFAAWERQLQLTTALRKAEAIRLGKEALVLPEPSGPQRAMPASSLRMLAWARVAPVPSNAEVLSERIVFGEEALGLVLAEAAVERCRSGDTTLQLDEALLLQAWALLANGRHEALPAAFAALDGSLEPTDLTGRLQATTKRKRIEEAAAAAASQLDAAEARLRELDAAISVRRTWSFSSEAVDRSSKFLHDALAELLDRLSGLEREQHAQVLARLQWARQLAGVAAGHPRAKVTWADARAALARADGQVASKDYAGRGVAIPEGGWPGLTPIGMNPVTKLWEFYDLSSAWDGKQALVDLAIPSHHPDGKIDVKEGTGIVFVLLPGGDVVLGAQRQQVDGLHFDPEAEKTDHVFPVSMHPFLMARHELTQAQWARMWTWDAKLRWPSTYKAGSAFGFKMIQPTQPVETVDWDMCSLLLQRYGMTLPTEAQWEYACRAGTTTPWSVPRNELVEVANLADEAFGSLSDRPTEEWADGHQITAPVASYDANGFGLFDMHGNVTEWCIDFRGACGGERDGDGLRARETKELLKLMPASRIVRGGHHGATAPSARSAFRWSNAPSIRGAILGLRPARLVMD